MSGEVRGYIRVESRIDVVLEHIHKMDKVQPGLVNMELRDGKL